MYSEANIATYASVLEGNDVELLRDILVEDVEYYSEASGKEFHNIDEYIEWVRYGQGKTKLFATKITITEVPASAKFAVGSSAIVLSYRERCNFSDIVFFEFTAEGKIQRIYVSKGTGYKYVIPANAAIEARIAEVMVYADDDNSDINDYMEEQKDNYIGSIDEFAFREAIRQGRKFYIRDRAYGIDLNDADGYSSYLYETDDPEIQAILIECGALRSMEDYADYRFAMESENGTILAFSDGFQGEVFQKYLETYDLSEDDVIAMFDDDDEAIETFEDEYERDFYEDMETMGISVEDDEISFENMAFSEGWELRDFIEELGWTCTFEGKYSKFGSTGVYFIR